MKHAMMWGWALFVVGAVGSTGLAAGPQRTPGFSPMVPADCRPGTRGEVPVPFCDPNSRYELADEESYVLPGWLTEVSPGRPIFEVNLTKVPHLAHRARKAAPLFRLTPGPLVDRSVKEFQGQEVMVSVIAHSKIVSNPDTGELRPEIFLELAKTPEPIKSQPVAQE
jgi:hypothetical protein